jgi:hypothetical protein
MFLLSSHKFHNKLDHLVSKPRNTWDWVIFNGVRIGLLFGRQWFKQFGLNNIKWRYQNVYVLYILHAQD